MVRKGRTSLRNETRRRTGRRRGLFGTLIDFQELSATDGKENEIWRSSVLLDCVNKLRERERKRGGDSDRGGASGGRDGEKDLGSVWGDVKQGERNDIMKGLIG